MDAKSKVMKAAAQRSTPTSTTADGVYEDGGTCSTCTQDEASKAVTTSDTTNRKRPHDSVLDSCDAEVTSPQSPPRHTRSSDTRACKKARLDGEEQADTIIISTCLHRLKQSQIQSGRSGSLESAHDLHQHSLRTILRHLKIVDLEAYTVHLGRLKSAYLTCASSADRERSLVQPDYHQKPEDLQDSPRILDAVLAFFDCNILIKLHPHLTGNPRLQAILRRLNLPLQHLEDLDIEFESTPSKTDEQRQQHSVVHDLLSWLSLPKPYPSLPAESTYNDMAIRRRQEIFMAAEVDQMSRTQEHVLKLDENRGRADFLQEELPVALAGSDDHTQQKQQQTETVNNDDMQSIALLHKKLDILSTQISSLSDSREASIQAERISISLIEGENKSVQKADVIPVMTTKVQRKQKQHMWGPDEEEILIEARMAPQKKADAYAVLRHRERVATYAKLQTFGQAYKIIIDQLIDAARGGPPSTNLDDLQMPDVEACYYRLHDLWIRSGEILWEPSDVKQLLINIEKFYKFAICMREAHCLLRVVDYYGFNSWDVLATGWDLKRVRWLQALMVDYVHEEPLMWSKPDVDAICSALQEASNRTVKHEHGGSVSCTPMAAVKQIAASQEWKTPKQIDQISTQHHTVTSDSAQPNQALTTQQVSRPSLQFAAEPTTQHMQPVIPVVQTLDHGGLAEMMDMDAATGAALPRVQTNVVILRAPNGEIPNRTNFDSYCRNWREGRCNNSRCRRLHHPVPAEVIPPSVSIAPAPHQTPQATASTSEPQTGSTKTHCKFWLKGQCRKGETCKFLHDPSMQPDHRQTPHNLSPPSIDITMSDATPNGDIPPTTFPPSRLNRYSQPCKHEDNSGSCTSRNCFFTHHNPLSKNFGKIKPVSGQPGPVQHTISMPRGPRDFTIHNTRNLGDMLPPRPFDAGVNTWAREVAQQVGSMGPPPGPGRGVVQKGTNQSGGNRENGNRSGNQGDRLQRQIQGNGGKMTCYLCGQPGHVQRDCQLAQRVVRGVMNGNGNMNGGEAVGGGVGRYATSVITAL